MKRAFLVFLGFAAGLCILFSLLSQRVEVPEIIEPPPAEVRELALVVDTHSDTLIKIIDDKTWLPAVDIGMDTGFHIDIPKLIRGGVDVQYFGAFTSGYYAGGKPDFERANSRLLSLFNAMYWTVQNNPRCIGLAVSMEDIESNTDIAYQLIATTGIIEPTSIKGPSNSGTAVMPRFSRNSDRTDQSGWSDGFPEKASKDSPILPQQPPINP